MLHEAIPVVEDAAVVNHVQKEGAPTKDLSAGLDDRRKLRIYALFGQLPKVRLKRFLHPGDEFPYPFYPSLGKGLGHDEEVKV